MHVLFCNYEYPPLGGGGGVINAALARALAKRHQVTVLTSGAFELPRDSVVDGVRVVRVPVLFRRQMASANMMSMLAYVIGGAVRGALLARKESFDIINTHFAVPTGPVGHFLSRLSGVPNVLSVHGGDIYDPSKRLSPHRHGIFRFIVRRIVKGADAVVAQSQNTKDNVHRYYTKERPIDLIPLGIDEPEEVDSPALPRSQLGFHDDDVLLLSIGRLVGRKQVEQLLEVIRRLDEPRAKLVVMGSGPQADSLKAEAERLGVDDQVYWTGFVDEETKRQILMASDVFVSTSAHEGFGLVFLEAMSYGLPVVCYDHGGQTDFLRPEENGYVVKLNNLDDFTESCSRLVADSALRERFGANNRRDVRGFFIEECANRYEDKFESVLAAGPKEPTRAAN